MNTFAQARRERGYRRLARVVGRRNGTRELLPLDDAEHKLRPFNRR